MNRIHKQQLVASRRTSVQQGITLVSGSVTDLRNAANVEHSWKSGVSFNHTVDGEVVASYCVHDEAALKEKGITFLKFLVNNYKTRLFYTL